MHDRLTLESNTCRQGCRQRTRGIDSSAILQLRSDRWNSHPVGSRWFSALQRSRVDVLCCSRIDVQYHSAYGVGAVSYTHLRAHETKANLVCRLLLEKK